MAHPILAKVTKKQATAGRQFGGAGQQNGFSIARRLHAKGGQGGTLGADRVDVIAMLVGLALSQCMAVAEIPKSKQPGGGTG